MLVLREDLAWNLYVELRKELLATQQLWARAIEFKITLVTSSLGLMVAYVKPLDPYLCFSRRSPPRSSTCSSSRTASR